MPVIYIDVLFLVNFVLNLLMLKTTAVLAARQSRWWRLVFGAGIGALYAVGIFFPALHVLFIFSAKVAVSVVIVCISFRMLHIQEFLKTLGIFYLVCFLFGGAVSGLLYFTGGEIGGVYSNGAVYFDLPLGKLFLYALLIFTGLLPASSIIKNHMLRQGLHMSVLIECMGRKERINALFDTGNQLTDPVSGLPVCVVEAGCIKKLFPEDIYQLLAFGDVDAIAYSLPTQWAARFRLIPFSAVGTNHGILAGIRPDKVRIYAAAGNVKECRCIIAMYPGKLSGGIQCIVNPNLLL